MTTSDGRPIHCHPSTLHRSMRSNLLNWLTLAVVLPAVWALASTAVAKEAAHEFLDKLRDRGYGEVTLDYLDYLKEHQLVPDDIAAEWDLYQARAWRLSVDEAFNPKEAAERREKAQSQLEQISEGASRLVLGRRGSWRMGHDVAERRAADFRPGPVDKGRRAKTKAERRAARRARRGQDRGSSWRST